MKNLNYEEDSRHEVSDKVLKNITQKSYLQDHVGIKKYNTALHHSLPYSWIDMAEEEVVDFMKYLQCEKDRKAYIIQILESALRVEDNRSYIETALELLTVKGTGK